MYGKQWSLFLSFLILVLCFCSSRFFSLMRAYSLMRSINMHIRKLKSLRKLRVCTYVFAHVHFLHFGELKMRFLHMALTCLLKVYTKQYRMFEVSIRVAIKIYIQSSIFPRVVSTHMLNEISAFIFKCTVYSGLILSFHILVLCF
jgi:hypothetical protein